MTDTTAPAAAPAPAIPVHDSRADTLLHSQRVGALLAAVIAELAGRAVSHDLSKVSPPEVAVYNEVGPRMCHIGYDTPEYHRQLALMGPALQHHYAHNPHHPQHYPNGVNGMTLVDLVEMLADWADAAGRSNNGGSLAASLRVGQTRFGIDGQLTEILTNTARHFGWLPPLPDPPA
jgi:hypothetical protein